jgi:hypothetical protein
MSIEEDWKVMGTLDSDFEKLPYMLLEDWIRNNWSLEPPYDASKVKFKYWDGYGDFTVKVLDGGTNVAPWNTSWQMYSYESFAMVHAFGRSLKGTIPDGLIKIRQYLERIIGQFPRAIADQGVYSIQTVSIMPGTDEISKQEVQKQTVFHHIFKVRMTYAKVDTHDRSA